MKLLDRYLLWRFVTTLVKATVTLVLLYVLIDLLTHREVAIGRYNIPWKVVFHYYLVFAPTMVEMVAPLAMLVTALLILGDCAQHNEITAALAGGVSLRRIVRMPVLVALVFALGLFVLDQRLGTPTIKEARHVEKTYFSRSIEAQRTSVTWANLAGDKGPWMCYIRKFNRIALTGEEVLIRSIRDDAVERIQVDRIYWDPDRACWMLEDGRWYEFDPGVSGPMTWSRVRQRPAPFKESPEQLFALEKPTDESTAEELQALIAYAEDRVMPAARLHVDYYAKFAWPAVSFVMAWLAIPFAMRVRRGGLAISFGSSITIAMVFLVLYYITISLGHAERIDPFLAAWLPNLAFLTAGAVLLVRTPT